MNMYKLYIKLDIWIWICICSCCLKKFKGSSWSCRMLCSMSSLALRALAYLVRSPHISLSLFSFRSSRDAQVDAILLQCLAHFFQLRLHRCKPLVGHGSLNSLSKCIFDFPKRTLRPRRLDTGNPFHRHVQVCRRSPTALKPGPPHTPWLCHAHLPGLSDLHSLLDPFRFF